jgi:hypothetical protein
MRKTEKGFAQIEWGQTPNSSFKIEFLKNTAKIRRSNMGKCISGTGHTGTAQTNKISYTKKHLAKIESQHGWGRIWER